MSPRWASRVDSTSKACIAAFRELGADWLDTSRTPLGIDGFALWRGKVIPVEFKSLRYKTGKVLLTRTQFELRQRGWPLAIITCPEDVQALLGAHGGS